MVVATQYMSFINRYNKAYHSYYYSLIAGEFVYAMGQISNGIELEGLITKIDFSGNVVWEKRYNALDKKGLRFWHAVPCANDDIMLLGLSGDYNEYSLMRITSLGDVLWTKYYRTAFSEIISHSAKLIRLNGENYLLHIADTYSAKGGGTVTQVDNHLMKVDGSGNILVQKKLTSAVLLVSDMAWNGTLIAIGGQQYHNAHGWMGVCIVLDPASITQVNKFALKSGSNTSGYLSLFNLHFRGNQLVIYGMTNTTGTAQQDFLALIKNPATQVGTGTVAATTLPSSANRFSQAFNTTSFYYTNKGSKDENLVSKFDAAFNHVWTKRIDVPNVFYMDVATDTHVVFHGYFYDHYVGLVNTDFDSCKTSAYTPIVTGKKTLYLTSDFSIALPTVRNTVVVAETRIANIASKKEELCPSPAVVPVFNPIGPVCSGTALLPLPTTSLNGITGSWSPALNNMATTIYTFTPIPGLNATQATMTIVVTPTIKPTFDQLGPFGPCDLINSLPLVSKEGIRGTWWPELNTKQTTTYTFTPAKGQCATGTTMTIAVKPDVTLLHEVCWTSLEDYQFNVHIPQQAAIAQDAAAAVDGITKFIQPVWRPDTSYYVHFTLKDTVDDGAAARSYPFTYGFSTAGAVGYFHTNPNATYGDIALQKNQKLALQNGGEYIVPDDGLILDDTTGLIRNAAGTILTGVDNKPIQIYAHPDKYALTGLSQYIDYDRSYPNADGNLLASKPLFYNDPKTELKIYFNKVYATNFFRNWSPYKGLGELKGRLKIVIKDPREQDADIVNPPYLDYDPADTIHIDIPQTVEDWRDDENPQVPFVISQYLNLYNANKCIITGGLNIKPKSKYIKVFPKHLKPSKLYSAIVNNMYDINKNGTLENTPAETRQVHKYVFQTSRYAHFREQVNSYMLKSGEGQELVERKAVFQIEKAFTPEQVQAVWHAIDGTANAYGDAMAINYQHAFDRVFEGILGFKPLDEAISTEFNIIRNKTDNKVIAVLIRNPEPFNIPKMPVADVKDTIVVVQGNSIDGTYRVLHSKDYSQVIIMHQSLAIDAAELSFRFQYKTWDGLAYTVDPELNIPNAQKFYTVYANGIVL
jgi:hypothetical protein